uniref:Uncharacterized protein n=1 Tax=Amphimedon queenslandica TaxID=400682 RepID=A0A1X7V2Y8_AMPQE
MGIRVREKDVAKETGEVVLVCILTTDGTQVANRYRREGDTILIDVSSHCCSRRLTSEVYGAVYDPVQTAPDG